MLVNDTTSENKNTNIENNKKEMKTKNENLYKAPTCSLYPIIKNTNDNRNSNAHHPHQYDNNNRTQKNHHTTRSSSLNYCNNCGKSGHLFHQCKNPITSYGVIAFRFYKNENGIIERQYLMIRRRDTLGYVDFLRGKYHIYNRKYIKNLIKQMTNDEIEKIKKYTFDELWYDLWKDNANNNVPPPTFITTENGVLNPTDITKTMEKKPDNVTTSLNHSYVCSVQYNNEKFTSREKFNILKNQCETFNQSSYKPVVSIYDIIDECKKENEYNWTEPEWGFSKGRRNYKESDYNCAIREMEEETGYSSKNMQNIKNINSFEETFTGSNYKCYKHKYYLMYMSYEDSLNIGKYEVTEVSCVKWYSFEECIRLIRSYNIEKIKMITKINDTLNKYGLLQHGPVGFIAPP
jgi:8-oxo-dGTP pyrophosphatase MutT (NUDIX family)